MFRTILPVIICVAKPVSAETAACENVPYSQDNCVRVLACIGDQGLYFDGQARGWDTGPVTGEISNGVTCDGTWTANGPGGAGMGNMVCADGLEIGVIYDTQDNETGTVIGRGSDSIGQPVEIWSGENVLDYLTSDGAVSARLPCMSGSIPMS
ncbi:MAG: hypothetical protein AAF801_03990 [Pseudomonadota bacterium]